MRADIIVTHEEWKTQSYRDFLAERAGLNGHQLPGDDQIKGSVTAYINHGRWVVECPDCSTAVVASLVDRRFFCPNCGNEANGGQWYAVAFPTEPIRKAVEAELLKRHAEDGFNAVTRNWTPGESVTRLRAENAAKGIT